MLNLLFDQSIDLIEVDLSCWKIAFNGSDLIRPQTLKDFSDKFKLYGFSEKALLSCYGMAETTLIISGAIKGTGPKSLKLKRNSLALGGKIIEDSEANHRNVVNCGKIL